MSSLPIEIYSDDADLLAEVAALPADDLQIGVPCVYCRRLIPAATFAFRSDAKRLLSAKCPGCERRVTLTTSTLRRWLHSPSGIDGVANLDLGTRS